MSLAFIIILITRWISWFITRISKTFLLLICQPSLILMKTSKIISTSLDVFQLSIIAIKSTKIILLVNAISVVMMTSLLRIYWACLIESLYVSSWICNTKFFWRYSSFYRHMLILIVFPDKRNQIKDQYSFQNEYYQSRILKRIFPWMLIYFPLEKLTRFHHSLAKQQNMNVLRNWNPPF